MTQPANSQGPTIPAPATPGAGRVPPVTQPPALPVLAQPSSQPDRSEQARKASNARWDKESYWREAPLQEAVESLAELRQLSVRAGEIVQSRMSSQSDVIPCYICDIPINTATGKWAGSLDRINPDTGLVERALACSVGCYRLTQQYFRQYGLAIPAHLKRPGRGAALRGDEVTPAHESAVSVDASHKE